MRGRCLCRRLHLGPEQIFRRRTFVCVVIRGYTKYLHAGTARYCKACTGMRQTTRWRTKLYLINTLYVAAATRASRRSHHCQDLLSLKSKETCCILLFLSFCNLTSFADVKLDYIIIVLRPSYLKSYVMDPFADKEAIDLNLSSFFDVGDLHGR